jgi:hypothetical protein
MKSAVRAASNQSNGTSPIEVITLANAATLVGVAAYALCTLIVVTAPSLYLWFFQSWLHGLSLETLLSGTLSFGVGTFLTGLVTFGAFVWAVTATTALLYNMMRRSSSSTLVS